MFHGQGRDLLEEGLGIFGLHAGAPGEVAPEEVSALADERRAAREARDFGRADELRARIEELGWEVQDVADGHRLIPRSP